MKKILSVYVLVFLFGPKLYCQLDTAAFRNNPGDLFSCTDDSSELLKDTIVFSKYPEQPSAFLVKWEKRCKPIEIPPYLFFQPNSDSLVFVYGFSGGKPKNNKGIVTDNDSTDFEERILILNGTWKYGKNKSIVIANFPAWKMNLEWKVEDHKDYWLFIRKK